VSAGPSSPFLSDARLAAAVAAEAGSLLLEIRVGAGAGAAGGAGSGPEGGAGRARALGDEGDRRANDLILARLGAERPHDAVLSEEAADDPRRLSAPRVWIVDPLDGTREYTMAGRSDWAVHVALWEAGPPARIAAAAVAQPALGAVYATDDVTVAGRVLPTGRRAVVVVSDSRAPAFAGEVAAAIGGDVVRMGSAGAKAMAVLRGEADAYLHAGGQWEWDSAAPVGVLMAAGFHASRLDGSPLLYNQPHPYLPDLVICRPHLAAPLLAALSGPPTEAG
jgi:3'(2'), 5'-bisphosphate nucleotidase